MDARLTVEKLLRIEPGEAHVIRNAGAIVTDDVMRSLIISTRLLGTREIAVIGHTACGLLRLDEDAARGRISRDSGGGVAVPPLGAFASLEDHLAEQLRRLVGHRLLPRGLELTATAYEVETGRLRVVLTAAT